MMNSVFPFSRLNRVMVRSLTVGALTACGLLSGLTLNLSEHVAKVQDSPAYAQEDAFIRYVRAAVEIEKLRRPLMEQVKQLTGGNVPSNVCSNVGQVPDSVREQVKGICENFADRSRRIVTDKYKLSRDEFNNFQRRAQEPEMRAKIEATIRSLGL